jgi:Polysaccharide deacetylase
VQLAGKTKPVQCELRYPVVRRQSVEFVLSADLDWASEYCIENFLSIADRFAIQPTIFVTHASAAIRKASREGRVELGIHPNFLQPSTHGESIGSIIEHVLELAPRATSVRCHRHVAGREIERALSAHGLRIDSNTHRHLQRGLAPIELPSGLLRLPVFFEDDIHWAQNMTWRFCDHERDFFSPGLKILNFHPFLVSLNAPDAAFYQRHKRHIPTLTASDAARLRHQGDGIATFLIETIRVIQASGCRFVSLSEMAEGLGHETLAAEMA